MTAFMIIVGITGILIPVFVGLMHTNSTRVWRRCHECDCWHDQNDERRHALPMSGVMAPARMCEQCRVLEAQKVANEFRHR